jgi:DNA-binding LytR/AlgR family response regulator
MKEHITLQGPGGTERIVPGNIVWCRAGSSCSIVFLDREKELVQSHNLRQIEKLLKRFPDIVRVHKNWLVNRVHIEMCKTKPAMMIIMKDKTHVPVSRRKKKTFIGLRKKINKQ